MDEKTISTYDKAAAALTKKFAKIGSRKEDVERAFSYVSKDTPKVIELGCGDGRDAREIVKYANDYTGIDASECMIEIAKRTLPDKRFEVGDIENYQFETGIDIVFAFASFLHVSKETLNIVLKKIYRSLSQGGVVYISVKRANKYRKERVADDYGERLFFFYSKDDLRELAQQYDEIYCDEHVIKEVDWLVMVFQKS